MAIAKVEPLLTTRSVSGPFDYRLSKAMDDVGVGSVLVVPFGRRRVVGVVVGLADRSELPEDRLAEPLEALEAGVPPELVELGRWVGEEYCSTPARGLGLVLPPGVGTGAEARRVRPLVELEVEAAPQGLAAISEGERLGLRQRAVLRALVAGPQLARGRGAIVLVPEIALTPQTMDRFRRRFGDSVALLHSRMPAGARYDEWRRLRSGQARICVGPRSAVFAPVDQLGLIVVDEEHDSSYKQESDPRYDAREVARRRAADAGAVLICGTATPRPESWHELERLELPSRVDGRPLPPVEIVDMRGGVPGPLHPHTREAFTEIAERGGKAILLINRRGWSIHLTCRSCGHAWECPHCDVSLILHRDGALRCHHCGHAEPNPEACPACSSVTIARVGSGTQRVEAELDDLLAPLEIFRLDSDSAAARGHAEVLRRFESAKSGVLVGTQMVAKGHDFPDVILSVVLDADGALRLPDFRSEERTFALITQLAGRSGRGEAGGRVLVQALTTGAPSIRHAAKHDATGFLAGELERRRALRYPPFSHLIEIALAGESERRVEASAETVRDLVADRLEAEDDLLGPAPLFRLRGRHRRRLVVKSERRHQAVAAVRDAVSSAVRDRALRQVSLSVDVDPQ